MKKNIIKNILSLCFIVLINKQAWCKIITVDNTLGSKAHTTSIQFAVDSLASAGDTIIVMPSYSTYSNFTIKKRIFIYAGGHSNTIVNKDKKVYVSNVYLYTTATKSTTIMGFEISDLSIYGDYNRVLNNKIYSLNLYNSASYNFIQGNVLILQSISSYRPTLISIANAAYYNIISNNFIQIHETSYTSRPMDASFISFGNSSNLITNNNFMEMVSGSGTLGTGITFFKYTYASIYNNIFWSNVKNRFPIDTFYLGSDFKNNISYSVNSKLRNLPTSNFNDTAVDWEGGYNSSILPFFRPENLMKLKSTSVGYAQGTDSTQIGIYGQNFNFSFEGNVPGVAVFEDFQVLNPIIKRGGRLKVRVKARKPQDN